MRIVSTCFGSVSLDQIGRYFVLNFVLQFATTITCHFTFVSHFASRLYSSYKWTRRKVTGYVAVASLTSQQRRASTLPSE
jgi:hypothetical protein